VSEFALAQRDTVLRFAFGVTAAFVLCEAMNWRPTAMAPALAGLLPARPHIHPRTAYGRGVHGGGIESAMTARL